MLETFTINKKKVHGLSSRFFEVKGKRYEIIGGQSTGKEAHEVNYDVRNLETREVKTIAFTTIVSWLK